MRSLRWGQSVGSEKKLPSWLRWTFVKNWVASLPV
jgi:hypothetical protein